MRIYLGRHQWVVDRFGYWTAPFNEQCIGRLDFQSAQQAAVAGVAPGDLSPGWALFAYDTSVSHPALSLDLGDDPFGLTTSKIRDELQQTLQPQSKIGNDRLHDILLELQLAGDPYAQNRWRSRIPRHNLNLELWFANTLLQSIPVGIGSTEWPSIQARLRADFDAFKADSQSAKGDALLAQKILGIWCEQYKTDDPSLFVKAGDPVPDPIEPETTVVDAFTAADGALGTTADGAWTFFDTGSQYLEVSGNQVRQKTSSSGVSGISRNNQALSTSSHYAQIKLITNTGVNGDAWGPMIQKDSSATLTYYFCENWSKTGANNDNWVSYRRVAGTYLEIGTRTTDREFVANDVCKMQCDGDTITRYVNGSLQDTTTDSAVTAAAYAGIRTYNQGSGTGMVMDDWEASDELVTGGGDGNSSATSTSTATGSSEVSIPVSATGATTSQLTGSGTGQADASSAGAGTLTVTAGPTAGADASSIGLATADAVTGGEMEGYSAGVAIGIGDSAGSSSGAITTSGVAVVVAEGQGSAATTMDASAAGTSTGTSTGLTPSQFVQSPDPGYDGSSPGVLSFVSDVTVGNTIVLGLQIGSTIANVLSVTDNRGNTYELDLTQNQTVDGHQIIIYHVDGAKEGPTTTTVLLDSAVTLRMVMAEYTRVGFLDQSTSTQGASAASASGQTGQTVDQEELVVGVSGTSSSVSFTSGSGYIKRSTAGSRLALEDKTVGALAQFNADWSLDTSTNWSAGVVTYRYSAPRGYASATSTGGVAGIGGEIPLSGDGFSAANQIEVTLSWDSGVDAVGYEVGYDTDSGDPYANVVNVGNVLSYSVLGLASGTWYFSVRSYDSGGTRSAWDVERNVYISPQSIGAGTSGAEASWTSAGTSTAGDVGTSTASADVSSVGTITATAASLEYHYGDASSTGAATGVVDNASTSTSSGVGISDGIAVGTLAGSSETTAEVTIAATSDGFLNGTGVGLGEATISADGSALGDFETSIFAEASGSSEGACLSDSEGTSTVTVDAEGDGSSVAILSGTYRPGTPYGAEGKRKSAQDIEEEEIQYVLSFVLPFLSHQEGKPLKKPKTLM